MEVDGRLEGQDLFGSFRWRGKGEARPAMRETEGQKG